MLSLCSGAGAARWGLLTAALSIKGKVVFGAFDALLDGLLKASNPNLHNYANARGLDGQSLRDVIASLQLDKRSQLAMEMHEFHRHLQLHEKVQHADLLHVLPTTTVDALKRKPWP